MRGVLVPLAAIALLCLGSLAQADVFNLGSGLTNLDTVFVGDAGNTADTAAHSGNSAGQGSVAYNYNIGKYEVTAAQYCDFLNHKANVSDAYELYDTNMWADSTYGCNIQRSGSSGNYSYSVASGYENRAVNYVSYWDACRFANWVGNGQDGGDTETGAYTLGGYMGQDGRTIQRNANCTWAVTSEDEWYKAAYYMGGGLNAGYWRYPTQSTTINHGMANYDYTVGHTTNVGAYANPSAYGTYDQGGNVHEWNESIPSQDATYASRGLRGGSFYNNAYDLQSSDRNYTYPTSVYYGYYGIGFRLSEVPEPSSMIALLGGIAGVFGIRRRRE